MLASRVLVVSDSHLSVRAPEAKANWAAAAAMADRFDLVVHGGDVTLDGAQDPDDLEQARLLLDELPVPWVAVPGNHDIGDVPGVSEGPVVDGARRDLWLDRIGPDRWLVDVGGWVLLGINAQLFGSGLDAEGEQWAWLEESLATRSAGRPVVLVTHKPLAATEDELAVAPPFRYVPGPARRRVATLLGDVNCPLVLSGHVHQYRVVNQDHRRHVWAPTTWAVLPEDIQKTVGRKRCGVLSLDLALDASYSVELTEPAGLAQLTLTQDVVNPYD